MEKIRHTRPPEGDDVVHQPKRRPWDIDVERIDIPQPQQDRQEKQPELQIPVDDRQTEEGERKRPDIDEQQDQRGVQIIDLNEDEE